LLINQGALVNSLSKSPSFGHNTGGDIEYVRNRTIGLGVKDGITPSRTLAAGKRPEWR
jgi:hypothetical protein